ncbi:MetQ/NlpA family ABC transporter substrate-binding protein [Leucobacter sp. gxy201]|uniref:MetQ/NlpA family ABC transporter substrate-binding protein n=1 Tax=Leucobacter sp. gxy201 TaxID=2957200 RepID=UPI003DA0C609
MKRHLLAPISAAAAALLLITGCAGGSSDGSGDEAKGTETLKVAATTTPMTDVVQAAGKAIEAPYTIEMVEVADYVQPNMMLQNGELAANFVQHPPFMEEYNAANGADLVAVEPVYLTVVGMYSSKWKSFDEVPEGGNIVIPQDASNAARSLQMVADQGLIELDPSVDKWQVTVQDIVKNPKNLKFTEIDIMQLVAAYPEADAVFLHGTFARQLELTPKNDAIAVEQDEQFAVSLVSRGEDEDSAATQALAKAFHSDEVRSVLEELGVPAAF